MSLRLLADGAPEAEAFEVSDEQIANLRETLLSECEKRGVEVSTLNRRNPLFIKATAAVEALDDAGFDWGEGLDDDRKYWIVIWASRKWAGLKRRYRNNNPRFVEVF
jgi:hypothetical protein